MSTKDYCPRTDLTNYEPNSYFTGSIVSTYSKLNRLVYCVKSEDVKYLLLIDDYKKYMPMKKKPGVGVFFVYYSNTRQSYYRAYNLGANPVDPLAIKAYFLDTGEIHYMFFEKSKYFYLPESLHFPTKGIFCKIKNFPKRFESALDFFDQCEFKKYKFNILEKGNAENGLGNKEECLIVDVEICKNKTDDESDSDEAEEDVDSGVIKLTRSALLKFNSTYEPPIKLTYYDEPLMSSDIPEKDFVLESNEKVIVYPAMVVAPNLYYGHCRRIHEASRKSEDLIKLMTAMNKYTVKYEKMDRMAILNEMVIICEEIEDNTRYYRGMVLEIFEDICMILYVDFGNTQPFHYTKLFKFPIEFSPIPFHTFRIHASNIQISHDESINHKNLVIVDLTIKPMCFGIVEKSDGFDVVVKLFDKNGHNMTNVIERMYRPLRRPKVSKTIKNTQSRELA